MTTQTTGNGVKASKGKAQPVSSSASDAQRAKIAQMTRAAILKGTEQKPVGLFLGSMPAVSAGSVCIDDLIGGTMAADKSGPKCPGYPRRHLTELYGDFSSGKTTAALEAVADVQRQGGLAMYLDYEHALDDDYARKIGVSFDDDKLIRYRPETLEQGWKMIYLGIAAGVDLIVVDSVAAMVPDIELNKKKPGDAAKIGAVAASMAQMLPKVCSWLDSPKHTNNPRGGTALVFINQIRATINGNGTNENSFGGYALKFFSHLRIKFTKIRTEFIKRKDRMTGKEKNYPYGNHTQVKLVKSRIDGKQGFSTDIFIRFNHGIDDHYSMIEAGVSNKVIKKSGSSYEYLGQSFRGRDKLRIFLIENPKMFQELRLKVLNSVRAEFNEQEEDITDEDDLIASMGEDIGEEESTEAAQESVEAEDFTEEDASKADKEDASA